MKSMSKQLREKRDYKCTDPRIFGPLLQRYSRKILFMFDVAVCSSCKPDFPEGREIVTFRKESHVHRLGMWRIISLQTLDSGIIVEDMQSPTLCLSIGTFRCLAESAADRSATAARKQTRIKERYILHASFCI